jgi:hypothetical protein
MVNYVNGFAGISVGMIGIQILLTLIGTPLNKNVIPFRMNCIK